MQKVNLQEKFSLFNDYWAPKILGEMNDQYLKAAKMQGEFIWHKHDNEDELFLVVAGELEIHLRDKVITLQAGEFYVVPKGVEHKPVAKKEVHVILIEPKTTDQTGGMMSELKVEKQDWI